jgi:hypothetical protein
LLEQHQPENQTLRRFRAEAAALLGIAEGTNEPVSASQPDNARTKVPSRTLRDGQ